MGLILLRHPKIKAFEGVCYGHTDCLPDPETFKAAVEGASVSLKPLLDSETVQWCSSPLLRCSRFSTALAQGLSAAVPRVSGLLMEMNFGAWENLAWESIERGQLDAWAADPWHFKPGGKESVSQLLQRWREFKREHLASKNQIQGLSVVVTHAGVIRMALLDAKQITEQEMWTYPVPYATPVELLP